MVLSNVGTKSSLGQQSILSSDSVFGDSMFIAVSHEVESPVCASFATIFVSHAGCSRYVF